MNDMELAMTRQKLGKESAIDVIKLVLGLMLISTPWIFGFTSVEIASRNVWVAGAMISVASIMALVSFAEWEEWISLLLGLWVADSPWALSFDLTISDTALRALTALGLLVVALAAVELWIKHRTPPRITA